MEELKTDINDPIFYKSCCFKIDKDFTRFFVQVMISFMILSLSIYKLIVITDSSEEKNLYVNFIILILGIYTPQPRIKSKI